MATFTWRVYDETGVAWDTVDTNTIVFSGSKTDLTEPITVGNWQDGTHLGTADPGAESCPDSSNHIPNVKYVSSTQFDLDGGGTTTLNDTNLPETQNTLAIEFTDASSVVLSNARFYCFDGTTATAEAVGVEAYAFEHGVGASTWTMVNDDSGNTGGDNAGEYLSLSDQTTETEHTYFVSVSARPETVGSKTEFDFGVALTYS